MQTRTTDASNRERDACAWLYVDEIAHRSMNDYAFMLASVERAGRGVVDPVATVALDDIKARLVAGVQAHRALRPPLDHGVRAVDDALEHLCAALSGSGLGARGIGLTLVCEPVSMSVQRCWQACLIVSELITNASKHAFAGCEPGEINIDVRAIGEELRLAVSDNGRGAEGLPHGGGMAIVNALADELGGAVWRRHTPSGSIFVIVCPLAA